MNERSFYLLFLGPLIALTIISLIISSIVIKKAYDLEKKQYNSHEFIKNE